MKKPLLNEKNGQNAGKICSFPWQIIQFQKIYMFHFHENLYRFYGTFVSNYENIVISLQRQIETKNLFRN